MGELDIKQPYAKQQLEKQLHPSIPWRWQKESIVKGVFSKGSISTLQPSGDRRDWKNSRVLPEC